MAALGFLDRLVLPSIAAPMLRVSGIELVSAMMPRLRDAGIQVLADVASLRHAEKALAAGVDGLVLLTAGAGARPAGPNPFAFVRAVRAFFDGPIGPAGGLADGVSLRAAEALGAKLGYMGTRFIATHERASRHRRTGRCWSTPEWTTCC